MSFFKIKVAEKPWECKWCGFAVEGVKGAPYFLRSQRMKEMMAEMRMQLARGK
jgi:hypothetical protein